MLRDAKRYALGPFGRLNFQVWVLLCQVTDFTPWDFNSPCVSWSGWASKIEHVEVSRTSRF
jgi:hypothetical protein